MSKRMPLTLAAAAAIAVIGGVVVTILLYYHKQTHVVWVTYFFLMAALLPFFWAWHQLTIEPAKPEEKKQAEPVKTEPVKAESPTPSPTPTPNVTTLTPTPTPPQPKPIESPKPSTEQPKKRELKSRLNVLWDENRDPFCPLCERRIIPTQVRRIGSRWMGDLKCMSCQVAYVLKDDDGQHVTFEQAKKLLRQEETKTNAEPPKPQPALNSEPADYEPDELAKKVLRYIHRDEGINPIEDLSKTLNVEPLEIEVRLDKLIDSGYVGHNEYNLLRGNNPYSLNPEGKKWLLKTPIRNIPFPTREAPRVFRYINAYHPDDTDNAILHYMYEEDAPRLLRQIAEKLSLNSHEARFKMNRLREGGYVAEAFEPSRREAYRLTDEGVEYILWLKPNDS